MATFDDNSCGKLRAHGTEVLKQKKKTLRPCSEEKESRCLLERTAVAGGVFVVLARGGFFVLESTKGHLLPSNADVACPFLVGSVPAHTYKARRASVYKLAPRVEHGGLGSTFLGGIFGKVYGLQKNRNRKRVN